MLISRVGLKLFTLAALIFLISSCQKESLTTHDALDWEEELGLTTTDVDADYSVQDVEFYIDENGSRGGRCFTLVFPVTIEFPDSTSVEVASKEELKELLQEWKENNDRKDGRPMLELPFDVELSDGTIVTVENREQLLELKKQCVREHRKDKRKKPCFSLVYPVTIEYPDGSTEEAGSKEELKEAIREWRKNNRMTRERPHLQFPFDVELEDGTIETVEDLDELKALYADC